MQPIVAIITRHLDNLSFFLANGGEDAPNGIGTVVIDLEEVCILICRHYFGTFEIKQ